MHGDSYSLFMGWHLWLGIIVVIAVVVFLASIVKSSSNSSSETPRQILDRRFANGEISEEDYQRMKKELSS